MPNSLPRPFPDLIDHRTVDEQQADEVRTGNQRQQLLRLLDESARLD